MVSEVPYYINESWKLPLAYYSLSFLFMTNDWSNHFSRSYSMSYTSMSMAEKIIQYIFCFAKHYITVTHQAFNEQLKELAFQ